MLVKKDGIYKTIDTKDYGIYQSMGFKKVVTEPVKVEEPKVEEPKAINEVKVEKEINELPKSKRKNKK